MRIPPQASPHVAMLRDRGIRLANSKLESVAMEDIWAKEAARWKWRKSRAGPGRLE